MPVRTPTMADAQAASAQSLSMATKPRSTWPITRLAHFSKFVRPGSVRIGSTELEQLYTVAFLTPEGKVVLVAANTGNFPKNVSY